MSSFPPPGVVCQQNIAIRAVRGDDAHRQDFILEFENEEDWRDKPLRWCYESRDTKNDVQRGFSGSAMGRAKRMIFSRTVYKTLGRKEGSLSVTSPIHSSIPSHIAPGIPLPASSKKPLRTPVVVLGENKYHHRKPHGITNS